MRVINQVLKLKYIIKMFYLLKISRTSNFIIMVNIKKLLILNCRKLEWRNEKRPTHLWVSLFVI